MPKLWLNNGQQMFNLPVYVLVLCTAYTASFEECGKTDGITACGLPAVQGVTVAADDLPFGTEVIINNQHYVVQDRFGGGHKNRIDIYMNNKEDALKFGRQYHFVEIVNKEENNK